MMKATSDRPLEAGLYMLKFHLLDDLRQDVERFGNMEILDASLFQRFNVHIKPAFRRIS